ncbi:hypothetical protein BDP81DRAFT_416485 [Colletotrichum phormii]|uniref:Uncharacterized protein n=1 Tax=Colletotrichum phormii TaxID=359342 RepID=A0AAJ0A1P5_9PEZI|nr:uncharacterized protein BDP81DRAFT_416485 [Colletotrichum phormii]KAK1654786.1 hypothetical protein BDP81DRAFT_416485 [Colletotrichum phormii]
MTRPGGAAREGKKTSFRHCIATPPVIGGWPKVSWAFLVWALHGPADTQAMDMP